MTVLITPRLRLEPLNDSHFDGLYRLNSDPVVMRYITGRPDTPEDTQSMIDRVKARWAEFGYSWWAFIRQDTGDLIGNCLLVWTSAQHRQGEIGYILNPAHHGHGYAPEAARALLRLGFHHHGLHRIIGRLDARNTASARVLEKIGMRREAHLIDNEHVKGEWTSEMIYAMLDTEWTP